MPILDSFKQILLSAVQDGDFLRKNSMMGVSVVTPDGHHHHHHHRDNVNSLPPTFHTGGSLLSQTVQRIHEITGQIFFVEDWSTALTASGNAVIDPIGGRIVLTQSPAPIISVVTFKPRLWQLPPRLMLWLAIPVDNQLGAEEYVVEYAMLPPMIMPPPLPPPLPPPPPPPGWTPTWTIFKQDTVLPVPPYGGLQLRASITNPVSPIEYLPRLIFVGATA